jgi:hypothetical protein
VKRGEITYDGEVGHVCTCTRRVVGDTTKHYVYARTVDVDRSVEPTESGSWWYVCSRCGAGAWSGC